MSAKKPTTPVSPGHYAVCSHGAHPQSESPARSPRDEAVAVRDGALAVARQMASSPNREHQDVAAQAIANAREAARLARELE